MFCVIVILIGFQYPCQMSGIIFFMIVNLNDGELSGYVAVSDIQSC
jgi:hypothetical protein